MQQWSQGDGEPHSSSICSHTMKAYSSLHDRPRAGHKMVHWTGDGAGCGVVRAINGGGTRGIEGGGSGNGGIGGGASSFD